ncbi:unnamed protein product [Gongylonema pulchrum]|uniref:G protein-coupled receptor n=1 Tax=Gongylonema pulchrum TaxID=637853 RepID=A0A183ED11_9BILA|nr:unnamed protein product [Gongylonema pulchrum]
MRARDSAGYEEALHAKMNIIESNEIFRIIHLVFVYTIGPLSLTLNALLLYMIFTKTPVKFNEFAFLKANIAVMAIVRALITMLLQSRAISLPDFLAEAFGPVRYIGTPSTASQISHILFWLNMSLSTLTLINITIMFGVQHWALTSTTPIHELKFIRIFLISTYIFAFSQAVCLFILLA